MLIVKNNINIQIPYSLLHLPIWSKSNFQIEQKGQIGKQWKATESRRYSKMIAEKKTSKK